MSCSLLECTLPLPGSHSRKTLDDELRIPKDLPKRLRPNYQKCIRFGRLMLQITRETAQALLDTRYKEFDALVKNFGCQITALEVKNLVKQAGLLEEAARVEAAARKVLEETRGNVQNPPLGDPDTTPIAYLQKVGLDLQLSESMLRLVRLHLLSIINTNIEKKGREVPRTNVSLLSKKDTKLKLSFQKLIDGLQQEESLKAADYIRRESQQIKDPRAPLIQRILENEQRLSILHKIASVPLLYNTEAVLRRIDGVVLVKNKLHLCGKAIPDAVPQRAYVKLPEERILSETEIRSLPADEALLVIEGYIKNDTPLEEKISTLGLITIVNANCAVIKQYASNTEQSPLKDKEALEDLAVYKANQEARDVIEIDHIYCASLSEEEIT